MDEKHDPRGDQLIAEKRNGPGADNEAGLLEVLRRARLALVTKEGCEQALRDLLQFTNLDCSPTEAERVVQVGRAPTDYIAMPVVLVLNQQQPGGVAQTPHGEVAFFNFQLALPVANLHAISTIIRADGQRENPAEGMLPMIEGRFVLPRSRVAPHVLEHMGIRGRAARKAHEKLDG